VIELLREHLTASQLSIYPEYADATRELAEFFGVSENEFTLTNGTDEAIQVLVNTFVDDGDEVVVLKPSYAMYGLCGGRGRGGAGGWLPAGNPGASHDELLNASPQRPVPC